MVEASSGVLCKAAAVYQREWCANSFEEDLALHLEHAYVISTPDLFMMGRPIDRWEDNEQLIFDIAFRFPRPNCWLVWLCAGDISLALKMAPFRLPWVAFQRNNRLRYHEFDRLYDKLSARAHTGSDPFLQGLAQGSQASTASVSDNRC